MFSATDYDELYQIMEESPQKKELLTRLLASHKMDISTISHEIRNPLTLVYSTLQLIESQHPEVASYKHWAEMRRDIEYMKHLLEELSSYNNGEELKRVKTDMNDYLKKLSLSFAASLLDTDIEFTSKIMPDLPSAYIDVVKMRQVLLNLLSNAKDAVLAVPHSAAAAITLYAGLHERELRITITDTGCGIASCDLASIFEPFVTHKPNGTGLGLAIAKRIIHSHKGSLEVVSEPGRCTSFTVTLPVQ